MLTLVVRSLRTRCLTDACALARSASNQFNSGSHHRFEDRTTGLKFARHIQLYHSQDYRPGGSAMRRLPAALAGLAATAFLGAPALAHHSQAMFDTSKEILIKGTVTR